MGGYEYDPAAAKVTYATDKRVTYDPLGVAAGLRGSERPVFEEVYNPGTDQFVAPGISLPMGGARRELALVTRAGRTRTFWPYFPAIPPMLGFEAPVTVDSHQVRLDPRVLVIPVNVTVFASATGVLSYPVWLWNDPFYAAKVFDRLRVDSLAVSVDSPYRSYISTTANVLELANSVPDEIFTQCGVQFHLNSYRVLPQNAGRETQLVNSCVCRDISDQIRPYFLPLGTSQTAIDVVVGGQISGNYCPSGAKGIACGVSNGAFAGACDLPAGAGIDQLSSVVLIDGNVSANHVIAHELGHMLGLAHVGTETAACFQPAHPSDTASAPNNLMNSGGVATDPLLTPNQCFRVRCVAARWLVKLGRLTAAQGAVVCAE